MIFHLFYPIPNIDVFLEPLYCTQYFTGSFFSYRMMINVCMLEGKWVERLNQSYYFEIPGEMNDLG